MTSFQRCIGILAIIVFCEGCLRVTTDITTFEQLQMYRSDGPNELRIMTTDRSVYTLENYALRDSVLEGTGTILTKEGHTSFKGDIPLSGIVYMQGRENDLGRTLLSMGFAGFVGAAATGAADHHGLRVYHPTGSCPYVYAWNGQNFVLQGEVFGTALGKALETRTACMLSAVPDRSSALRVRITNERPETHYINALRLLAFDAPAGSTVLLDNSHHAWPVLHPQQSLDSPPQLRSPDGTYWRSDLRNTGGGGGFRDTVELTFPCPKPGAGGSLIIHAVNTHLANTVYDLVFGYLDDDYLRFLDKLENDPRCVQALREWIDEASLSVEVWRGGRWVCEGSIAPEAITVDIKRIVRVSAEGVQGDSLRVRLSSLADLWELDAVALDWTPVQQLMPRQVSMRSAEHTAAGSVSGCLSANDRHYAALLPGERIDVEFDHYVPSAGHTAAYALEASGYLYEWPPESAGSLPSPFHAAVPEVGLFDRLEIIDYLIRHRELVLAIVYERWRDMRFSESG